MISIAGIGSRETPDSIMREMIIIGAWCNSSGITVNSGHAEGADWAFEQGAQETCTAFLPWSDFNSHLVSKATLVVYSKDDATAAITRKYHPAYDRLSHAVKKLMERNTWQVLGQDLNHKVSAVVCWTKDGKLIGGTSQAIRIADAYGIPVINMGKANNKADTVIAALKSRLSFP